MPVEYFRKKQIVLQNAISMDFVRDKYMKRISSGERMIGLIGSRGAGKTTLLLQYLKSGFMITESLYMSADDIAMNDTTLYAVADEFYSLNGKILVIDEIHKYKDWSKELKNIYDSFPGLKIRFSGSSMLNILHEQYDLSRRAMIVQMNELSFKEYLEFKHKIKLESYSLDMILKDSMRISGELVSKYNFIFSEFKEYLRNGCYPYFAEMPENFSSKLFNSVQKIIFEDIPSLNKIEFSNLSFFQKLIHKVSGAGVPYKVNLAQMASETGLTQPTLYTYLEILDKSGIFRPVRKYSEKISKKPDKIYFRNTSIMYAFANEFGFEIDPGTFRETFFAGVMDGEIFYSDIGDFRVGDMIFEIGGKSKDFTQIKNIENSFLIIDTDITANPRKIPLWLFGFLER